MRKASRPLPWNVTTTRMVDLYNVTLPRLVALRDMVRPLAGRHVGKPVPATLRADVCTVLKAARRVVSREAGAGLLDPGPLADWTGLLGKLELALAAFGTFRARYHYFDSQLGVPVWRDEIWLNLLLLESNSTKPVSGLHESSGEVIATPPG